MTGVVGRWRTRRWRRRQQRVLAQRRHDLVRAFGDDPHGWLGDLDERVRLWNEHGRFRRPEGGDGGLERRADAEVHADACHSDRCPCYVAGQQDLLDLPVEERMEALGMEPWAEYGTLDFDPDRLVRLWCEDADRG